MMDLHGIPYMDLDLGVHNAGTLGTPRPAKKGVPPARNHGVHGSINQGMPYSNSNGIPFTAGNLNRASKIFDPDLSDNRLFSDIKDTGLEDD